MNRKCTIMRSKKPTGAKAMREHESFTGAAAPFARAAGVDAADVRLDAAELTPREVADLVRDPSVAVVAPSMPTRLIEPVGATRAANTTSWGVAAVGADKSNFDGTGVVVAILDTGIDAQHPAFAGVTLVQQDFSGSGNGDKMGHGTHCAGTVFGRDVGGARIGVARGVTRALIGKVLGDDGGGSSDALYQGMTWALQNGARVISMSLGFDFPGLVKDLVDSSGYPIDFATSLALEAYRGNLRMFDAIMQMAEAKVAMDGGAVVVAAAGNESKRDKDPDYEISVSIPAAAAGVLSVGALEEGQGGLGVARFSNTHPEISAPGVAISSAKMGGGLVAMNGTSMATPHVAGVAALWWQSLAGAARAPLVAAKLL
ncbi:MAG: hypothetical protein A2V77_02200, partial [Anaeromyxobacter sp. RBG_16_69_14]